jgi:hypothetical protein
MARSFNGTSDFCKTTAGSGLMPQSAFSFAAWVFYANFTNVGPIADVIDFGTGGGYFQTFVQNTGQYVGRMFNGAGNQIGRDTNTGVITTGSWFHVGFAWDGGTTAAAIKCYVNGVQSDTTNDNAGTFSGPYNGTGLPLYIAAQPTSGVAAQFTGFTVADIALWSTNLSAIEFLGLFAGIRPPQIRSASLFAYFPFDGLQSPEPNVSANFGGGGNLNLTGTALASGPPFAPFTPRWPQVTELPPPVFVFNLMPQIVW